VISIIGVLIGLLLPAVQSARGAARRAKCLNNMRNVGLALTNYQLTKNAYPNACTYPDDSSISSVRANPLTSLVAQNIGGAATFNVAIPAAIAGNYPTNAGSGSALRSWVVDILPQLDNQALYNNWDLNGSYRSNNMLSPGRPTNLTIGNTALEILTCPDDLSTVPGLGNLSYVVNGGFARWHYNPAFGWQGDEASGGTSATGGAGQMAFPTPQDAINFGTRTGVMFLGTNTGRTPWDARNGASSIADGTSTTILLSENLMAGASQNPDANSGVSVATNWATAHPNFVMFIASDNICSNNSGNCGDPSIPPGSPGPLTSMTQDDSATGWRFASAVGTFENINFGTNLTNTSEGRSPFLSSNHSGGVNVVMCDGSAKFIRDTINGVVYSKLITPAGTKLPSGYKQLPVDQDAFE